MNSLSIDAI